MDVEITMIILRFRHLMLKAFLMIQKYPEEEDDLDPLVVVAVAVEATFLCDLFCLLVLSFFFHCLLITAVGFVVFAFFMVLFLRFIIYNLKCTLIR